MTRPAPVPVLTAVTDLAWEATLVADIGRMPLGITVVRRCVDLADLLAVASTGVARAAVVSADLRRLDRDALVRLAGAGVAVVGVVAGGDEAGERRLRQLGVATVLTTAATATDVGRGVLAALSQPPPAGDGDGSEAPAAPPDRPDPRRDPVNPAGPDDRGSAAAPERTVGTGRLLAVWGPAGAPGRTSVGIGLAAEFAALGVPTLLVDADVYGGTVAQLLGLLEETPGLAAACRLANTGALDLPRLAGLARQCGDLRVLPGISRPARWPEVRPAAFEAVLTLCRSLAAVTVVDCGFSLEQDEELMFDTAAPRRNGATLAALAAADTVVAVGSADPVGVSRLVRGLGELREVVPGVDPVVVVNRARRQAVGGDPRKEVGAAVQRYAGIAPAAYVPYDLDAYDAAVAAGRMLREVAPGSPARRAVAELAGELAARLGAAPPGVVRRRGRQRSA